MVTWPLAIATTSAFFVITLAVYRLYLHPLSRFPGPKLAAITRLYEAYYDVVQNGQYTFEIAKLHEKYGKFNPLICCQLECYFILTRVTLKDPLYVLVHTNCISTILRISRSYSVKMDGGTSILGPLTPITLQVLLSSQQTMIYTKSADNLSTHTSPRSTSLGVKT